MANVNGDLKRLKVGTNLNINDIKEPTTKITTPGKLQLVWSTPEKVTTEIITIPAIVEQTPRIRKCTHFTPWWVQCLKTVQSVQS